MFCTRGSSSATTSTGATNGATTGCGAAICDVIGATTEFDVNLVALGAIIGIIPGIVPVIIPGITGGRGRGLLCFRFFSFRLRLTIILPIIAAVNIAIKIATIIKTT